LTSELWQCSGIRIKNVLMDIGIEASDTLSEAVEDDKLKAGHI
jgi:hypothetical protein